MIRVKEFLGPDGPIASRLSHYEFRQEQLSMAEAVEQAQRANRHLVVEAGTGVGKSFAYLVPCLAQATEHGRRAVVSTYTISLQEQLMAKDIPLLASVWPEEFRAVLVKGRNNYLCLRRLERATQRAATLFVTDDDVAQLKQIVEWAYRTEDGTLSDLDPQPSPRIWSRVASEQGNCLGRKCPHEGKCFYQRMRRRMMQADLLVVNHALLLSDLAIRAEGSEFLPSYSLLVVDEAHNLESVASDAFGLEVASGQVRYLLDGLYNAQTDRGLLAGFRDKDALDAVRAASVAAAELFDSIRDYVASQARANGRIIEPDVVPNPLSPALGALHTVLRGLLKRCPQEDDRLEVAGAMDRCMNLSASVADFIGQAREQSVYWVETDGDPALAGAADRVVLHCQPIHVGTLLRQQLFMHVDCAVLTSATLAVGTEAPFDYIKSRLGLIDPLEVRLGSPFDYAEQMVVHVEAGLGDPNSLDTFVPRAVERILHYIRLTEGKAFVLFTSYRMLNQVADLIREPLKSMGIQMFQQGGRLPRNVMLERFREDIHSVLLGTESFWQGVDVPGESLSNVIITKLPFAVPDQPVTEARIDEIRRQGGNPFMDYQIPEAVLRLKQGIGRLIRTRDDRGIVVILDNRVVTKRYGRLFLESLPECPVEIHRSGPPPRRRGGH